MSWNDDKSGKGDVFSPVSWDSASKADSNWAFSPTSSNESSFFSASVWDSPSNQTNYFSPVELTPLYGSVENNRNSSFSANAEPSWAFKSAEATSDKPSFGFGDSFGFKADQDLSYLENNQSKVFDVFSNTAADLENYHATRSMKESRAANSWFTASNNSESSNWAFSKEEPAQKNSVFSPSPSPEANNWAFSREEPSTSVFSPSQNTEQNNWAFARSEQPSSNFFSSNNESSLSSWAFSAVEHSAGDDVSKIVNPFTKK